MFPYSLIVYLLVFLFLFAFAPRLVGLVLDTFPFHNLCPLVSDILLGPFRPKIERSSSPAYTGWRY